MHKLTVVAALRSWIQDRRVASAKESLEAAVRRQCAASGDLEEHLMLQNYFKRETQNIDPWLDHHGFANMRQKFLDEKEEAVLARSKLGKWTDIVARKEDRLRRLTEGFTSKKRPILDNSAAPLAGSPEIIHEQG